MVPRELSSTESVRLELQSLLDRLHVLVVGPGLGREDYMQKYARLAVTIAKEKKMYLVLDADALFMVGKDISIIKGYEKAVVTPNVVEFKRLSEAVVSFSFSLVSVLRNKAEYLRTLILRPNLLNEHRKSRKRLEGLRSFKKARQTLSPSTRPQTNLRSPNPK